MFFYVGFVAGHLRFRFHTPPEEEEMEQNAEGKDEEKDESQPMDLAEPSTPAPAPASSSAPAGDVTSWTYAFEPSQNRASTSAATSTADSNNSANSSNNDSVSGAGAAGCNLIGAAWTSCPANYIEVEVMHCTSRGFEGCTISVWLLFCAAPIEIIVDLFCIFFFYASFLCSG